MPITMHRWLSGPPAVVRVLRGWHALVAVAALLAVVVTAATDAGPSGGLAQPATIVLAAVAMLVHGSAAVLLAQSERHLARALSLAGNYLLGVAALAVLLQTEGVFTGLDTLAERFSSALPYLAVALVGWLISGGADAAPRRHSIGRILLLIGFGAALVAVGLLAGLWTFASRVADPLGLTLVFVVLTSFTLSWRTYQQDIALHFGASARQRHTLDGLLFVSPNLLGFFAFFAGPLLFSLFVSLNEWDAFGTTNFVGLRNYVNILSLDLATIADSQTPRDVLKDGYFELTRMGGLLVGARDPLFWRSIMNIIKFAVLAVPLAVVPAVFLASLLNSKVPGIKFFRALYFVPSIAGVIAVALIWRQLFNSTVGWVNYLITKATSVWNGLPLLPEVSDPQVQWLSDADVALFSLVIVFAWQYIGFNTVLFFAGLQGIPQDLYEAATLDGASRWQQFRHITLPALRPTTFFVGASTGILALQLFGESVVLFPTTTPAGAGPGNATLTPVVYLYEQGFRRFSQGYASAVAWILFALIFAFTFLQFQRQREQVGS